MGRGLRRRAQRGSSRRGGAVLASSLVCVAALAGVVAREVGGSRIAASPDSSDVLRKSLEGHDCPCGCGNALPGSARAPACFGCSVGKAEVARAREGLASGRKLADVILELGEPVLLDVFADYTHPALPETWARAEDAMAYYQQHRLVLRTPGATAEARRAVALAECARRVGHFGEVHRSLVDHQGPWDAENLLDLAERHGLARDDLATCLSGVDVSAQMQKDRQHAAERGFSSLPSISINRSPVAEEPAALRAAIGEVLRRESI